MVMKPHVLNAKIATVYVSTDAGLTIMGFEITHEEMAPSVFSVGMINCRVKFPLLFQSVGMTELPSMSS